MKKQLFLVACAALTLASCSEKETVEMPKTATITFGDTFVGNATRAASEITDDNIRSFFVFGGSNLENNQSYTNEFNNVEVTSTDGTTWTYADTRYWTDGLIYVFNAYAPALPVGTTTSVDSDGDGVNFTDFVATDGSVDLIEAAAVTKSDVNASAAGTVDFTFSHILSMIKLTFESEFGDNVKLTVSDITLKAVPNKASYTSGIWGTMAEGSTVDYDMGDVAELINGATKSSDKIIVVPQSFTDGLVVEFKAKAEYVEGGVLVDGTQTLTATLPTTAWAKGNRYNYVAKLNINNIDPDNQHYPIVFGDPTVNGWSDYSEAGDVDMPVFGE